MSEGVVVVQGLGREDLPEVYRKEFLRAVEWARRVHDPCQDWMEFREALWSALVPAFGLDVDVVDLESEIDGSSFESE